jgi:tetratricopeptide (TPR) repeat protein/tRNA A-37 threonylcarbamoyl transferase component Bud32
MSHATPGGITTDRDVLFGILAVQLDFVSRDTVTTALRACASAKERTLADVLVDQGALPADVRSHLELLVDRHVRMHEVETAPSTTGGASVDPSRETLKEFDDAHVNDRVRQSLEQMMRRWDPATAVSGWPGGRPRFRVVRQHAQGGVGEVFVAHDEELNRPVALKEIQAPYAADPVSRGRFLLEAEVTGSLEHPGIVPVYSLGFHADGRPYYAMRLIEGRDLREAIEDFHAADKPGRDPGKRRLSFRELLGRFVAVCNAVAFAHSKGVLHRDLKPANIMLGKFGETLVVDWGLAKVAGHADQQAPTRVEAVHPRALSEVTPTHHGAAVGTPAYMSPEQAAGQLERLGPASDIYSLGATLYSLLAGVAPVRGTDLVDVLQRVRRGEVVPARQLKPDTPLALDAVCRKAMAQEPAERYATALDLAAEIEHWLADEPVMAYRETIPVRAGRWVRRHRLPVVAIGAAALVALLLGGAGLVWLQRDQARRRAGAEAALEKARELQASARWTDASAALEHAEERLAGAGPPDLRRQLDSTRRDLALAARLDDLRLLRAIGPQGTFGDRATSERDYEGAFVEAGPGGPAEAAETVAARVRESAVKEVLVAALDDWALLAPPATRAWVLEVARRADPDVWRDRLRDPAAWDDEQVLGKRASETPPEHVTPGLAGAVGGRLRRLGEGEELLRTAQALHPGDFWLNRCLGAILRAKNQWREAEAFERAALAVRPDSASATNCLGLSLFHQGKLKEAADKYRDAMKLDPKDGYSPFNLTRVLLALGDYPQAGQAARRALEFLPPADPLRPQAQDLLKQAKLGERLPSVLRGDDHPAGAAECVAFGELCFSRQRFVDAVRFFREAFAADPALANDLRTKHRYNAACYATLAACGKGEGARKLSSDERTHLREQALAWLQADLALRARQLDGSRSDRAECAKKLRMWQRDEDLAGVREVSALTKLPDAERKRWEELWAEVKTLLDKGGPAK